MRLLRHITLLAFLPLALLAGCSYVTPAKPAFQPLTLDLSGDLAPRDPSAAGADVYCNAGHGTAMMNDGQWREYKGTGFVLPGNGAASSIRLEAVRGSTSANLRGYFDEPGQRVVFCPVLQGPPDMVIDCMSLYVLGDDLTVGVKRTFDVPKGVQGGQISCAYDQANLKPL